MFTSFTVKNFRCFRELTLEPLEQVNLIAGRNNVGKTALLEAIHLHGQPDAGAWANAIKLRGISEAPQDLSGDAPSLFWNWDTSLEIQAETRWHDGTRYATKVRSIDQIESLLAFSQLEGNLSRALGSQTNSPRLVVESQLDIAEPVYSIAVHGASVISEKPQWRVPNVLVPSSGRRDRDIRYFGQLEVRKQLAPVVDALRIIEPRLQGLSLAPFAGAIAIHADVGFQRLVPVSLVGEGFGRLLSLVLAISNNSGGVLLIDEIENGFHYSVQKQVWSVLGQSARASSVQIFATTHSWECLRWAHEAFAESDRYEFRLHRLDRVDDNVLAVGYNRDEIESALFHGIETR